MALKIALITTVLASLLSTGDFLKCYGCAGSECTELTCPYGMDRCMKAETQQKGVYVKSCGNKLLCDADTERFGLKKWCCEGDLCNGAGAIKKSLLLLLVPLASIFVLS